MPQNYILTSDGTICSEDELKHYGVRGMKWGVRRYQNSDGTLTAEGRKRAKKEYKEDNAKAYELGRQATISGYATAASMRRTARLENKLEKQYEKDPDGLKRKTRSLNEKWQASAKTSAELAKRFAENRAAAEEHCKSLIDKYGQEAVSSIKYKDIKMPKGDRPVKSVRTVNERTNKLSDYAMAGVATLASSAFAGLVRSPISLIYIPKTAAEKGRSVESALYNHNRQEQKNQTRYSSDV